MYPTNFAPNFLDGKTKILASLDRSEGLEFVLCVEEMLTNLRKEKRVYDLEYSKPLIYMWDLATNLGCIQFFFPIEVYLMNRIL